MTYDDWRTAGPPEARTLEVTLKVVVRIAVDRDPELDLDREASKVVSAIEGMPTPGFDVDEIDATVVEREIVK